MLHTIVSGGQTGVDQSAWETAKRYGLKTDGWMPRGYRTEAGPRPEFAELYGAREHESRDYPPRTAANVELADFTLILAFDPASRGTKATLNAIYKAKKPGHLTDMRQTPEDFAAAVVENIGRYRVGTMNVAGNRENDAGTIGPRASAFLSAVFEALGFQPKGE